MKYDEDTLQQLLNHFGCGSVEEAMATTPHALIKKVAAALTKQAKQLADTLQLQDCKAQTLAEDEQLMHLMAKGRTLKQAYLALYGEQQLLNALAAARPKEGAALAAQGGSITHLQPDQLSDSAMEQILAAVRRGEKIYF